MTLQSRLPGILHAYTPSFTVIAAVAGGYLLRGLPRPGITTMSGTALFWQLIAALSTYAIIILIYQYDRAKAKGGHGITHIRTALLATSAVILFIKVFLPVGGCAN